MLVQPTPEHALEIARGATADSEQIMSWCVRDGHRDGLVGVIDARRALVLGAARTSRAAPNGSRRSTTPISRGSGLRRRAEVRPSASRTRRFRW